jgi:hypothetical protein
VSDSHLPCRAHAIPEHAVLLKATAQHGRRETACGLTARVRLLPAITRSSTKLSDAYQSQMQVASVKPNTVYHGRGKKFVTAPYKKDDLLHCWTSSSDISGYHADIHEGHGTVGAGQGFGMTCVN